MKNLRNLFEENVIYGKIQTIRGIISEAVNNVSDQSNFGRKNLLVAFIILAARRLLKFSLLVTEYNTHIREHLASFQRQTRRYNK